MKKLLICIFLVFFHVSADEIYTVIIKKHELKTQSRWTLADWLSTKQRISLMDQWLALNTESNIFELVLGADKFNFQSSSNSKSYSDNSFFAKMYLTFFGLEANKQNSNYFSDVDKYAISLRLLGASQQSTHLNIKYGQLNYQSFSPKYIEADFEFYLASFLGLSFNYLNSDKDSVDNESFSFRQKKYGAFIELWFLRIFYEKSEDNYFKNNSKTLQNGERIGLSLYF